MSPLTLASAVATLEVILLNEWHIQHNVESTAVACQRVMFDAHTQYVMFEARTQYVMFDAHTI